MFEFNQLKDSRNLIWFDELKHFKNCLNVIFRLIQDNWAFTPFPLNFWAWHYSAPACSIFLWTFAFENRKRLLAIEIQITDFDTIPKLDMNVEDIILLGIQPNIDIKCIHS